MGQTEIETLRQIPLEDFLARLGHEPIRKRGNEWWYAAPYRTERTPSFRVNVDKQLWYDFGLGKGGDIFTLAGEFVHSCDFMEQAKFITEAGIVPLPPIEPRPHKAVEKKPAFEEVEVRALSHRALLSYLEERGVASAIAGRHCKEIHFRLNGKRYFAIGFGNRSGGFELRNRFFKGCIPPKDITLTKYGSSRCHLYEGFMDWLSALALGIGHAEDSLVLNSVANADKAIPALENYHEIVCHLDHDDAGRRTVGVLRKRFGERVADHSGRYSGYKDLNEYLVAKQKISNHQNKE